MSWLSSVTVLVQSSICLPAFAKCPFARKSRIVGRSRCRGYSSQLARRRGAGGRSLCLESIGHRPPVRPLWKRSLFWVCRLACMASVILLSITLCLACPGCYAVFSCFQSCPDSLSRSSSVDTSHVSGPGIGRVSSGMSLMILTGSGPRWQTLVLPQLHHGFRRVGASPLPLGCSSVWPRL